MFATRGNPVHCRYFDSSGAFDIVNNKLSASKLIDYGLPIQTVSWISSYLRHRAFHCRVDGSFFSSLPTP